MNLGGIKLVPGGIVLGGIVLDEIVLDGKSIPPFSRQPVYLFQGNVLTLHLFLTLIKFRT